MSALASRGAHLCDSAQTPGLHMAGCWPAMGSLLSPINSPDKPVPFGVNSQNVPQWRVPCHPRRAYLGEEVQTQWLPLPR
jgi:hypothetical protein